MDPVKVVIFVAAFLLLLLLGRKLSSFSESAMITPLPESATDEPALIAAQGTTGKEPAVIGADLPFPIHVPEVKRDVDGRYNRPEFLNYYFEETDLVRGPGNPASFYDNFYLLVRDIENSHTALYKYFVATPAGLQKAMDDERLPALYLEEQALIVARWDVPIILDTVVKAIMKSYAERNLDNDAHALPGDDDPSESG
ncbi:MAG TPA: hypothetical protein VNZ47_05520 [Candidatus Dormibacteraeota bacterium]|jgi:hypothetical protein|nr:hypothetical protein [Candidatus Dormibacteraeota bacterium]